MHEKKIDREMNTDDLPGIQMRTKLNSGRLKLRNIGKQKCVIRRLNAENKAIAPFQWAEKEITKLNFLLVFELLKKKFQCTNNFTTIIQWAVKIVKQQKRNEAVT